MGIGISRAGASSVDGPERRLVVRVPVQTSFGLALLPLPVTIEAEAHPRARSGASERAREEAFYHGFPDGGSRQSVPAGVPLRLPQNRAPQGRPLSEWKVLAGLVSLRRHLSRRLSSLRRPSPKAAPSQRG
jgi:hypothetical protein